MAVLGSLGPTVLGFFGSPLTISRDDGAGGYTNGIWQYGTRSDVIVRAHVHVMDKRHAERLPENVRATASLLVNTTAELFATDPDTGTVGDTFLWNGERYEITHTSKWPESNHYEAVAARIKG